MEFVLQLLLVIVLLASVMSADLVSSEPVTNSGMRVLLTAVSVCLLMLFAQVAAGVTSFRLQQAFQHRATLLHSFARWKKLHLVLWAGGSAAILFGLQWTRLVRVNWRLGDAFLIDEFLILLPVLIPLLFSWAAFYEVDRTIGRQIASRGGPEFLPPGCLRYVITHARHHLGLLLISLLLVVAFQDVASWLAPADAEAELPLFVYLPLLLAIVVFLPVILRAVWPTEPLASGDLRSQLEEASDDLGVSVRQIYVWKTNRMIANAAVAGILPRLRYVFLSDALLSSMRDDQIVAVYAHELGHVRHRHLGLRVLASLFPLVAWMAVCATFPTAMGDVDAWIAQCGLPIAVASPLLMLAVMAVYARIVLTRYSRLLEHQADLEACRETNGENGVGGEQLTPAATRRFIETLEQLTRLSGQSPERRTWLHPSVQERMAFLSQMAASPTRLAAFENRMRRLARLCVMLTIAASSSWAVAHLLWGWS